MTAYALPAGVRPGGRFDRWRAAPPGLVVADVDGTVVGPAALAAEGVVAAVARAQEAGIRFGFATGRMRLALDALWRQLRPDGPHVIENGAQVRDGGRTVAAWPLHRSHLEAVLALCAAEGLYAEVYVDAGFYVTAADERARPHWDLLGHDPLGTVDHLGPGEKVFKCTIALFDDRDPAGVEAALRAIGLEAGAAGSPLTPGLHYVNANHPDADKGRALRAAAFHAGLELAEVVAIGDGRNDVSMFDVVGTAVAMGQASDEVKAAAHLIAPTVDEDGVATVLDACVAWRHAAAAPVVEG